MRAYTYSATKADLSEDIQFENTLLRNGIISPSVEEKLANFFDDAYKDIDNNGDSMLDTVSVYTVSDLSLTINCNTKNNVLNTPTDTLEDIAKVGEHNENTANEDCSCVFATSTPVRIEFDPYSQLFPPKIKSKEQPLDTLEDNLEHIKMSECLLTETLGRTKCVKTCLPKLKKSFKKVRKSSKKGALTALTVILTNIL